MQVHREVCLRLFNLRVCNGIAIAMWETEADMAASEASGGYYREQLARGAHFFTAPPVWEAYEVTIHE